VSSPASIADAVADWHPAPVHRTDRIDLWPVAAFAALLDLAAPADLPPLWHWFSFLEAPPQSALGEDGHPADGHFLPPIPDRRRMIAGGRAQFHVPLPIGADVVRHSRLAAVRPTSGRTGELVFVTVRHEVRCDGELAVVEEQDVVYRSQPAGAPRTTTPPPAAPEETAEPGAAWRLRLDPDTRTLFRFSALTYNGHRIHYDHPYATEVEGYPGLVVHGPLIATLLLDLLTRELPDAAVSRFAFRALKPTFDLNDFEVCGRRSSDDAREIHLWARHADGALAMDATATLA